MRIALCAVVLALAAGGALAADHIVFDNAWQNGWRGINTTDVDTGSGLETVINSTGAAWAWFQPNNTADQDLSAYDIFTYDLYFANSGRIQWHKITPLGQGWSYPNGFDSPMQLDGQPHNGWTTPIAPGWHTISFDMSTHDWWMADRATMGEIKWQIVDANTAYIKNMRFTSSAPPQVPGDANGDGVCDVGDLGILGANYNTAVTGGAADADFNGDGLCDVGDLGILGANYTSSAAVPEPATLSLLGLGVLALRRRR